MKKSTGILIGGVVAAAATAVVVVVTKKDEIIVKVKDNIGFNVVKVESNFGFPNSKFPVTFTITNDNAIGAKEVSVEGELYYEGQRLGKFDKTSPIDVKGKETTEEEVLEVKVNLFDLVGNLVDVITTGSFSNEIEVRFVAYSNFPTVRGSQFITVKPT